MGTRNVWVFFMICCLFTNGPLVDAFGFSFNVSYTQIGCAIAGGAIAVVAAPVVLSAVGFTAGGVAAGSIAASTMGPATAAGSTFAVLQSAGTGLTIGGTALVAGMGTVGGYFVGTAADKVVEAATDNDDKKK